MTDSPDPVAWAALAAARYLRLTTFRRDGTPVATAVWLVRDGDHLLVITGSATGKVKRIRHTPRVLLAPSDLRGRVRAGIHDVVARAEIVDDPAEIARLLTLLKRRYGLTFRALTLAQRLRGQSMGGVELRLTA